jgi:hypothetical protein
MNPRFDVFRKQNDRFIKWVGTAENLEDLEKLIPLTHLKTTTSSSVRLMELRKRSPSRKERMFLDALGVIRILKGARRLPYSRDMATLWVLYPSYPLRWLRPPRRLFPALQDCPRRRLLCFQF